MANNNHFNLNLDTLGPTGNISWTGGNWINTNRAGLTFTYDSSAQGAASYMKYWYDTKATLNRVDYSTGIAFAVTDVISYNSQHYYVKSAITAVENTGWAAISSKIELIKYVKTPATEAAEAAWEPVATTKDTAFATEGTYYYHVIYKDIVNNESPIYSTSVIGYEHTNPEVLNSGDNAPFLMDRDTGSKVYTNDLTVKFGFKFQDLGTVQSGVVKAVISGSDIDTVTINNPVMDDGGFCTHDVTFKTDKDESKTVSVVVTDAAGNSSTSVSASIIVDRSMSAPTLSLNRRGGSTIARDSYINTHEITATLNCDDTDIAGWKIWENGQTEPDYTRAEYVVFPVTKNIDVSTGDGNKQINAKIIDKAGTEKTDTFPFKIDTVGPVKDKFEADKYLISQVSGYNTAKISYKGHADNAPIDSWSVYSSSKTIASGSGNVDASTDITVTSAGLVEGNNTITFKMLDSAGNETTNTITIVVDITGPAPVISGVADIWYRANNLPGCTISSSDAHQMTTIYVWADYNSTPATALPTSTPKAIAWTSATQTIAAADISYAALNTTNANCYMHSCVVDEVGNKGFETAAVHFKFDKDIPTISSAKFSHKVYASTAATVNISATDVGSGVADMQITGDISNGTPTGTWETFVTSRDVTLTTGDGYKTVTVKVRDGAGNESEVATDTTDLDTGKPGATLVLRELNDSAPKPAFSPIATFSARVSVTNEPIGKNYYQLYGKFTAGSTASASGISYQDCSVYLINTAYNANVFIIHDGDVYKVNTAITKEENTGWSAISGKVTQDNSVWKELVYDTPSTSPTYKLINNLIATSTEEELKDVNLIIMDNAGNKSEVATQNFFWDPSAPEVTVGSRDNERVSKIHILMYGESSKYSDECKFKFTVDEKVIEYKVCAYATQAAAEAVTDPASEVAIGETHGSTNMSGTAPQGVTEVSCCIKGADYEDALVAKGLVAGGTAEGIHIVVVYAKNEAGVWSVAAEF